jgi:hypothetical protein
MNWHLLVLNEWVIHDLLGRNERERQEETKRFLEELIRRCDQIAVLRGSPWMMKAYYLMEQDDPLIRGLSRQLHLGILRDPDTARILEAEEVEPLPEELEETVPKNDRYVVQTYLASGARLLVTTDDRLRESLSRFGSLIQVRLRDEFIAEYLKEQSPTSY